MMIYPDTRCRFNEAKYKILKTLYDTRRDLLPREIAAMTGLSRGDVRTRLSKMHFQGYIWRKKVSSKGENGYVYRNLKPMGWRVLKGENGLERRMEIREITGENLSLNLKKLIPYELLDRYKRALSTR